MQLSLITETQANIIMARPFDLGLAQRLLGPEYRAKTLRGVSNYGCRHCMQPRGILKQIGPKATGKASSDPKIFAFNGLRSHMKEK